MRWFVADSFSMINQGGTVKLRASIAADYVHIDCNDSPISIKGSITGGRVDFESFRRVEVHYDGTPLPAPPPRMPAALRTYPSPPGTGLPAATDWDGYVGLAPISTDPAVLGTGDLDGTLLAGWNDGSLDAQAGGGPLTMVLDRAGPTAEAVPGSSSPGHLLVDGLYAEEGAVPAFRARGNTRLRLGTIAFWFKPSWDASAGSPWRSSRAHHLLSLGRRRGMGETQSSQLVQTGDHWPGTWSGVTGFHFERSFTEKLGSERLVYSPSWYPPAARWTHIVLTWNLESVAETGAIELYVDGKPVPGGIRNFLTVEELERREHEALDPGPDDLLRLGERLGMALGGPEAASPDGTYDEFISLADQVSPELVAARYAEGRYHRTGTFTGRPTGIGGGATVLWAGWTIRRASSAAKPPMVLTLTDGASEFESARAEPPAFGQLPWRPKGDVVYEVEWLAEGVLPDAPRYENVFLDEVTIAYARTAPVVLAWAED